MSLSIAQYSFWPGTPNQNDLSCREENTKENLNTLESNLVERGYPSRIVREKIYTASREWSLKTIVECVETNGRIYTPFVVTRNPRLPPLHKVIKEQFPIFQLSAMFKDSFKHPHHPPLTVIYRQIQEFRVVTCVRFNSTKKNVECASGHMPKDVFP